MKKVVYFFFAFGLMYACSPKVLVPTQADVNRVQDKFPGYTLTELNEGKKLFESYCGNCHDLPNPTKESESEWKEIVPNMAAMINKKEERLNQEQQDKILKYVITMGSTTN